MTTKKIPLRMCLGCGAMKPKRELIRVVRQQDGAICLDVTGRMAGRGAYLCPRQTCLEQARKARRLEKAFACRISDAVYDALQETLSKAQMEAMPDA